MHPSATKMGPSQKLDLLWQLTVRAVELRHRGSHLGMVWAILNPLLMLALYFVVFSYFFGSIKFNEEDTPQVFALGIFLGLILYHALAETIGIAPTLIVSQPNLVKKVVFPVHLLPVAQLGAFWFHAFISTILLVIGIATIGPGVTLSGLLWLPLIVAPVVLLSVGVAWTLSALGVFFRDIGQVIPFATQILLWTSCVFYSVSHVQGEPLVWMFLKWNPLMHSVDLARHALLWHEPINLKYFAYTWIVGAAAFLFGAWFFRKLQPAFADVI
jgi:lipopolysaccharide transport system permease protein